MILTRAQQANIVATFEELQINQQKQNTEYPVNYVLIQYERNINSLYIQRLRIYPQEKRDIEKETKNLYISV